MSGYPVLHIFVGCLSTAFDSLSLAFYRSCVICYFENAYFDFGVQQLVKVFVVQLLYQLSGITDDDYL